jgi:hypothetical protein
MELGKAVEAAERLLHCAVMQRDTPASWSSTLFWDSHAVVAKPILPFTSSNQFAAVESGHTRACTRHSSTNETRVL